MKYTSIIVIVLVMISGLVSCNSQRPKEIKAEWQLVWEEDFNGSDIDYSVWSKIPRGKSDWNNYMSDYDSLYEVANGNLILRGIEHKHTRQNLENINKIPKTFKI